MNNNDTIAALASGFGAVAVLRVSGPKAEAVLSQIFVPFKKNSKERGKPRSFLSHMMNYGHIQDKDGQILDEVMCVLMKAPRTYTREDMAEIYCHGGQVTVSALLNTITQAGARPAEPGEFTKRAFLNGRIDLSQAEAVMELISAKNDMARKAILRKLSGGLSQKINKARETILKWLAHIELSIDYPEHEEESMNMSMIQAEGEALIKDLESLQASAKMGKRLKEGIPTVIVGRPNVGKSSLMNAILQEDRAIVTNKPGTTRDTLTEELSLSTGIPIKLTDTAGIRESQSEAEQIGIERTIEQAKSAELIIQVIDRSTPTTEEDQKINQLLEGHRKIIVLNKCDLPPAKETPPEAIEISAKTGAGLKDLYHKIEELFQEGQISADSDIITNARHHHLLTKAIDHLKEAQAEIKNQTPEDLISIPLKSAYTNLSNLTGQSTGEDIINKIFEEFCLGK